MSENRSAETLFASTFKAIANGQCGYCAKPLTRGGHCDDCDVNWAALASPSHVSIHLESRESTFVLARHDRLEAKQ